MGRDSEDKAGRILSIYTRLKQGKVIYKQEESIRYGVAERTIQRDIVDIQCFLEEHASTSGEIQEIIFEKALGGYVLQTKKRTVKSTQEQAVASWIMFLNQRRLEILIDRLNQQDINLEEALNELNEIKKFIGDEEHIHRNASTKHGEIAEDNAGTHCKCQKVDQGPGAKSLI